MTMIFSWQDLATLSHTPGTGGQLRRDPEDFVVEELPAYLPSGEGDHLYLWVEKRGHTTAHVARELSAQLGVKAKDMGIAGLKDRHAVTRQWLSIPSKFEPRLGDFALEGVQLLEVSCHGNKLGMGHLHGNRFTVRVRGAAGMAGQAAQTLALLQAGIPNYFGPQRFGLGGLNAEEGLRVLRGESRLRDPQVKRFLVSSVQSLLFNRFVSLRLQEHVFDQLLRGDMAKKHDTGGVFLVEDAGAETPRALRGEVSATGTLFGRKIKPLTLEAGALEGRALAEFGLSPELFGSRKGDRRLTRVFAQNLSLQPQDDGYTVSFALPKGSFATSLLRELMKTDIDLSEIDLSEHEPEGSATQENT